MKQKIILDLCGGTGSWSKPYKDAGYEVFNMTLPEVDITKTEFGEMSDYIFFKDSKGDTKYTLRGSFIYGILAAPPCTMFSDARTHAKTPRDLRGGV